MELTRRDFLKASSLVGAALGLQAGGLFKLDEAMALEVAAGGLSVIWFEAQACTGCSVSLLNSIYYTTADDLLLNKLDLNYHATIMAAAGKTAVASAQEAYNKGGYVLVVEGAIPAGNSGKYCTIWKGLTAAQALAKYARKARFIISVGACASYGGMAAAKPNPTGAAGLAGSYYGKRVIKLPGCPVNPDWVVGTIAYILKTGSAPQLDSNGRPVDYYSQTVHSRCPWREEHWAPGLGKSGCLRGLGCKGPETHCDCPNRRWNSGAKGRPGMNWCIGAGAPCYGCTEPGFPDKMSPFYTFTTGASQTTGSSQTSDDGEEDDD